MTRFKRRARRGATVVQVCLVLSAVTFAVFLGAKLLGQASEEDLSQTATEVGDPANLVARFGHGSTSGGGESGGETGGEEEDDWLNR